MDDHAAWRVDFLKLARWINLAVWLGVGVYLWLRYHEHMPLPFDNSWLFDDSESWGVSPAGLAAQFGLFAGLIAALAWISSGILRWLWSLWVRGEQKIVLANGQPEGSGLWLLLLPMWTIVWMPLAAVLPVVFESQRFPDIGKLLDIPVTALGYAIISTILLLLLRGKVRVAA